MKISNFVYPIAIDVLTQTSPLMLRWAGTAGNKYYLLFAGVSVTTKTTETVPVAFDQLDVSKFL